MMYGPARLSMRLGIAALSFSEAPAGIESDQKDTLCGPPSTSMNRTVPPAGTVIELGSNLYTLPLPIIFTSTTGPVGSAAAAVAGAAAGVAGAALACA